MAKAKQSLIERLKQKRPQPLDPRKWINRQPEETRAALFEIREAYLAGEFAHKSVLELWRDVRVELPEIAGTANSGSFRRFIHGDIG